MGTFKDLRDLHKASKQFERPTMRETLRQMRPTGTTINVKVDPQDHSQLILIG